MRSLLRLKAMPERARCIALVSQIVFALLVSESAIAQNASDWLYGGFVDIAYLNSFNDPANHLFRNRGTTPRVDEWDINMAAAFLKKTASGRSRVGVELTVQTGQDSKIFGFSATAPTIGGADTLLHFGPTNVSYLAPIGKGLTIQGGIFSSLIGYDSLYAKDNLTYTRPWGADYTPYLMIGVNASYPMTDKMTGTIGVVNGYWHLAHANDAPSLVGQLAYKASDQITFKQTVLYGSHQPSTGLEFWRVFSDTIVERKAGPLTIAAEYQLGTEKVDAPGNPRALWTSAQVPVRWVVQEPWSITVRPEFAWDRDGRWISGQLGAGQSIKAVTTTLERRVPYRGVQGILRLEYRFDDSRGAAGGFFDDGNGRPVGLTPQQHLIIAALIVTFDSSR
jgi:Putative beta-barrel porin-2, OmpL-like. bbp2